MRFFFIALLGLMLALASLRPAAGVLRRYQFRNPLQAGGFSILQQKSTKLSVQDQRYHSGMSTMTAETSTACADPGMTPDGGSKTPLPELSPADFRLYNRLADMMEYYVCRLHRCVFSLAVSGG